MYFSDRNHFFINLSKIVINFVKMALKPKCFICLTMHMPTSSQNSSNQLHYIFHYLKTREKKGKFDNDQSLQMQLCYECETLVESFSLLYNQLEKVEMEVEACLKQICNKILRAEGTLVEAEEIREELMLNCASKVRKSYPQLKLSRLGEDEIKAWRVERSRCTEKQGEISGLGTEQTSITNPICKVEDNYNNQFIIPDVKEETDDFEDLCHNGFDDLHSVSEPMIIPTIERKTSLISQSKTWNAKLKRKYRKRCVDPRINSFINESSPLNCVACGITCADKAILQLHIERVHQNVIVAVKVTKQPHPLMKKRCKCDQCEASFAWPCGLRVHKRRQHSSPGMRLNPSKTFNFKCEICGSKFLTLPNMRSHMTKSHRDCLVDSRERFSCDLCEKTFTQKVHCQEHYKSKHMGIKFECRVCRKQFSFKASLNNHQKFVCGRQSNKKSEPSDKLI